MNWTDVDALRAQVQKWWLRGDLLASLVTGQALFPKRLVLKGPDSAQLSAHFDQVRLWIAALRYVPQCRVVMRTFTHRQLGANQVPDEVWIDTLDNAVALIGVRRKLADFLVLLEATRAREPGLLPWLAKRGLRALELSEEWSRLLDIIAWLRAKPRPGIYLREVDIAGVHSKFIEAHRGILAELFDQVLPATAIDASASGVSQFERRYGFREKPLRVRFRLLDSAHPLADVGRDISLDAASFAKLALTPARVFITENEINFLAFPPVANSLVIFGAGYGFEMLREATWLAGCPIFYWGDIDTHGFAILDQLRSQFPQVESFLMDRETLLAYAGLWGTEDKPTQRTLPYLTAQEAALYEDLLDNRLGPHVRLEQERIGFGSVAGALGRIVA